MQYDLFETKLSKQERKRIERIMVDYHRMPAKIEAAKMRAEQAVTASYNLREGSSNAKPGDPTANLAIKRDEIANMERFYKLLQAERELCTPEELTIWDTVFHPRHRYSTQMAADAIGASRGYYHKVRMRLVHRLAASFEGEFDIRLWKDEPNYEGDDRDES